MAYLSTECIFLLRPCTSRCVHIKCPCVPRHCGVGFFVHMLTTHLCFCAYGMPGVWWVLPRCSLSASLCQVLLLRAIEAPSAHHTQFPAPSGCVFQSILHVLTQSSQQARVVISGFRWGNRYRDQAVAEVLSGGCTGVGLCRGHLTTGPGWESFWI